MNKVVAQVNVRNFCLKQIPQKSTLKKFSKNKNTLLAPVFWEIEEKGQHRKVVGNAKGYNFL